jgi:hypothetical protein
MCKVLKVIYCLCVRYCGAETGQASGLDFLPSFAQLGLVSHTTRYFVGTLNNPQRLARQYSTDTLQERVLVGQIPRAIVIRAASLSLDMNL